MARINKITRDGGRVEDLAKSIVSAIEKSPIFSGRNTSGNNLRDNKSDNVLLEVRDKMTEMLNVSKKISEVLNKSLDGILKKVNNGIKVETSDNSAKKSEEKKNDAEKQTKAFKDIFKDGLKKLKEGAVESVNEENKSLGALLGGLSGALGGYMVDTPMDVQKRNKAIADQAAQDAKNAETANQEGISQNHASVVNALGGVNSKQGNAALQATDDGIVGNYSNVDIGGDDQDKVDSILNEQKKKIEEARKKEVKKIEENNKKLTETLKAGGMTAEEKAEASKAINDLKPKEKKKEVKTASIQKVPANPPQPPAGMVPKIEKARPAPVKKQTKSGMEIGTVKETDEGVKYQYAGKNKKGEDIWKLQEDESKRLRKMHVEGMNKSMKEGGVDVSKWIKLAKEDKKNGTDKFGEELDKLSDDKRIFTVDSLNRYTEYISAYDKMLDKHKKGVKFKANELKDVKKVEQAKYIDDGSAFANHKYYDNQKKKNSNVNKGALSRLRKLQKQRADADPEIQKQRIEQEAIRQYGNNNYYGDIRKAKEEDSELQSLYDERAKLNEKAFSDKGLTAEEEERSSEINASIDKKVNKIKADVTNRVVALYSPPKSSKATTGSTLNANAMRLENQKSSPATVAINAPNNVSTQNVSSNPYPANANNGDGTNRRLQGIG